MNPSLEAAFDEVFRKLDEIEARLERYFSQPKAAEEFCIAGLEQFGTTELVVADNWGGLFDEISAFSHHPALTLDAAFASEFSATDAEAALTDASNPSAVAVQAVLLPQAHEDETPNHLGTDVKLNLHDPPTRPPSSRTPPVGHLLDSLMEQLPSRVAAFVLPNASLAERLPRDRIRKEISLILYCCNICNPCAEDDGADDPVDPGPKFASPMLPSSYARCSNGRLVINFLAETFGLQLLPPSANKGAGVDGVAVSYACYFTEIVRISQERAIGRTVFPKSIGEQHGHSGITCLALFFAHAACGLVAPSCGTGVANAGLVYFNGRYYFDGQLGCTIIKHPKLDPATRKLHAQVVFDKMPSRYAIIIHRPHSHGAVPFGPVSGVEEAPEVFEEMAKHISDILWPPPMHISNMLCTGRVSLVDKNISCFSPPSCYSWDALPHRQPSPPPWQLHALVEILNDGQRDGLLVHILVQFQQQPWPPPLSLLMLSDTHVLILQPWSFFSMVDGDMDSQFFHSFSVQYLAPISLICLRPLSYPSHHPPYLTLNIPWLDDVEVYFLCHMLDLIWVQQPGQEVVYQGMQWLLNSAFSHLGFDNAIALNHSDGVMGQIDVRAVGDIVPAECCVIQRLVSYNEAMADAAYFPRCGTICVEVEDNTAQCFSSFCTHCRLWHFFYSYQTAVVTNEGFSMICPASRKTQAHPFLLAERQELCGVLHRKMQLLWSCYEVIQDRPKFGNAKHEEVPCPLATKNELLLKLEAASINPVCWKIQEGMLDTQVWCDGGLLFSDKDLQVPWDPGGAEILHRLGGKPKLKKGEMSGITQDRAIIWALGLGLGKQLTGPLDASTPATRAHVQAQGRASNIQTTNRMQTRRNSLCVLVQKATSMLRRQWLCARPGCCIKLFQAPAPGFTRGSQLPDQAPDAARSTEGNSQPHLHVAISDQFHIKPVVLPSAHQV